MIPNERRPVKPLALNQRQVAGGRRQEGERRNVATSKGQNTSTRFGASALLAPHGGPYRLRRARSLTVADRFAPSCLRAFVPLCLCAFLASGAGDALAAGSADRPSGTVVVKAAELHTGTGEVIRGGMLLVEGGTITALGIHVEVPAGATVIDVAGASITPGLIDAAAAIESEDLMTEGARTPYQRLHGFFCPRHKDHPVVGCCGSSCPNVYQHVSGQVCKTCGFPRTQPDLAVGTRSFVSTAEQSSEVIPHTRVIDGINLRSVDFDRLLAGGVTTVFVSPDSSAVISSQGAIVRTGGPVAERIVRETDAVKAVMGSDSFRRGPGNRLPWREHVDFHARRPRTRMGVTWVFRKALYDAQRRGRGMPVSGADAPSEPALTALEDVLAGEIPLRIQARMQQDVLAAIRLAAEFDLRFVLEEATEAHLCVDELRADETPVVYGPIYMTPTGYLRASMEVSGARLHTFQALLEGGIETALTAGELRDEDGLARQAMYAIRDGVPMEKVTRSVTQTPARLLRLDDKIGTLAVGKQADLVVWSGRPFDATTEPVVVLINGRVVHDRRKES